MAMKLSALSADRSLPPGSLLTLISVKGWVNSRAILRLEELGRMKNIQWPHRNSYTRPSGLKHSASTNYAIACHRINARYMYKWGELFQLTFQNVLEERRTQYSSPPGSKSKSGPPDYYTEMLNRVRDFDSRRYTCMKNRGLKLQVLALTQLTEHAFCSPIDCWEKGNPTLQKAPVLFCLRGLSQKINILVQHELLWNILAFYHNLDINQTGFCPRLQVEPTQNLKTQNTVLETTYLYNR
jgi:hypothetical protein